MENQGFYLEKCRKLIERKLNWGESEHWQNQDFELLSEKIFDETKVSLSCSTLKRIWGKVKYDGTPNTVTLNVLAKFSGYDHWRDFLSKNSAQKSENLITDSIIDIENKKFGKPRINFLKIAKWTGLFLFLAVMCISVFAFFFNILH